MEPLNVALIVLIMVVWVMAFAHYENVKQLMPAFMMTMEANQRAQAMFSER
jgi:hypothetical protein